MKGVELPINVLVVVAIAVIVLLGLIALFAMGFAPFAAISGLTSIKNAACTQLLGDNCATDPASIYVSFDANKDESVCTDPNAITDVDDPCYGKPLDTLEALCANYYNAATKNECRRICNCPGY